MSLRVTTSKVESDIVVLHFSGTMTIGPETHAREWLLRRLLCREETKWIFDLAGVDRIDAVLPCSSSSASSRCGDVEANFDLGSERGLGSSFPEDDGRHRVSIRSHCRWP